MSINESSMWAAVHRMESASEQMARAAEEITQAVQRFAFLLEPGYGGNGLRLIELLEQTATQPEQSGYVSVPRELLERVESHLDRTTFAPFGEPLPPGAKPGLIHPPHPLFYLPTT